MTAPAPVTIRLLQCVLGVVCVAVAGLTLLGFFEVPPPVDPGPPSEYDGMMEGLAGAAELLLWLGAFLPAAALLLAIWLRSKAVSWTALVLAGLIFLLEVIATIADGLEGPEDLRPWLLGAYAGVLLLTVTPKSRAYLGVSP